jgi:hypothetical protein
VSGVVVIGHNQGLTTSTTKALVIVVATVVATEVATVVAAAVIRIGIGVISDDDPTLSSLRAISMLGVL